MGCEDRFVEVCSDEGLYAFLPTYNDVSRNSPQSRADAAGCAEEEPYLLVRRPRGSVGNAAGCENRIDIGVNQAGNVRSLSRLAKSGCNRWMTLSRLMLVIFAAVLPCSIA